MAPSQLDSLFEEAAKSHRRGELAIAAHLFEKILGLQPGAYGALHMLGVVRAQQGRYGEAMELFHRALRINPGAALLWTNYAQLLRQAGQPQKAIDAYDKALALNHQIAEIHYQRSLTLVEMGRLLEALESSENALALKPAYLEGLRAKAYCLSQLGRFEDALIAYDHLLSINPRLADAFNNRGSVLIELQRLDEAVSSFDKALGLKGDYLEAHANRCVALRSLERLDEALASCNAALAINRAYAPALYQRALILRQIGQLSKALAAFEQLIQIQPDHPFAHGMAAEVALSLCEWDKAEHYGLILQDALRQRRPFPIVSPLIATGLTGDPAMLLEYAKRYGAFEHSGTVKSLTRGKVHRHEKIRLGYVSADFTSHPVAHQIIEIIEKHDRAKFEVFAISLGRAQETPMRTRLAKAFDHFEDVHAKDDRGIAEMLVNLELDIAVDLNGYTRGGRRRLFAYRPAPIQVNFLGYPGTIGDGSLDYIIGDPVLFPEGQEAYFSEKIVRLSRCFFPQDTTCPVEEAPSRIEAGLPPNGLVFCAFNHPWKFSAAFFRVWMSLLNEIPESVIWMRDHGAETTEQLRSQASIGGIDPSRLIFAPHMAERQKHLARHALADLFLDTLPYNGHATASDALWCGVPVLSCAGQSFAGRVSSSLLHAAGLAELVVGSLSDYQALGLALARDTDRLEALKSRLKQNRTTLALFDMERLRLELETAYRIMISIDQKGEAPHAFNL